MTTAVHLLLLAIALPELALLAFDLDMLGLDVHLDALRNYQGLPVHQSRRTARVDVPAVRIALIFQEARHRLVSVMQGGKGHLMSSTLQQERQDRFRIQEVGRVVDRIDDEPVVADRAEVLRIVPRPSAPSSAELASA